MGFGSYGTRAKLSPGGFGGNKPKAATAPAQTLSNYGAPINTTAGAPNQTPIYQSADADYIRNLPTAYTPEQQLLMKSNAANQQAASTRGGTNKIRELMAAQGLSGSGAETGAFTNYMNQSNANLANTMSGIDISNANQNLSNSLAKGGLMNNLMGLGLNENQFGQGLYSDLYKWGKEFDYNKYRDDQSYGQYQDQLDMMKKMLGSGGSGGYGGLSNPYVPQRGRG